MGTKRCRSGRWNARTLITCRGRGMLPAPKLALRSTEWLSSDLGAPFPERGGVTSARVGSSPERRPRGGPTAGWRKRQSCSLSTATVRVVMFSPSIRSLAHIWRFPTTCVFARLIRRPSLRNCRQFRGQAGTTSCEPGGCRSVRLRSLGAGGRASKRLPDMPSPKKGSDAEKPQGALKLTRLRKCANAERRRHRYPLPAEDLPPLGRPVATAQYGIVVFIEVTGELAESSDLMASYPNAIRREGKRIWGRWRSATLAELVRTWPAPHRPGPDELLRGWWQPTLAELRVARRNARSLERKNLCRKVKTAG